MNKFMGECHHVDCEQYKKGRKEYYQGFDEYQLSRYEAVRDYIKHEDTLINNRLTWLLVSQGLIFSSFCALFRPISTLTQQPDVIQFASTTSLLPSNFFEMTISNLQALQCILCLLGLSICLISWLGINAAMRSIRKISNTCECLAQEAKLPPLTGAGDVFAMKQGSVTPPSIPLALAIAWGLVIFRRITLSCINREEFYTISLLAFSLIIIFNSYQFLTISIGQNTKEL